MRWLASCILQDLASIILQAITIMLANLIAATAFTMKVLSITNSDDVPLVAVDGKPTLVYWNSAGW